MAIAVEAIFQGPNATLDNYKQALTKMGATPGGPHPDPDCLFHWATDIVGGFKVTDVWTGKAEFDKFAAEKIGPVSADLGMSPPQVTFIDVDSYLTSGGPSPL
jgi:hypothetical protein